MSCVMWVCVSIYILNVNIKNSVSIHTGTEIFHFSSQSGMEFKILTSILKIVDISIPSNIDIPIPKNINALAPFHSISQSIMELKILISIQKLLTFQFHKMLISQFQIFLILWPQLYPPSLLNQIPSLITV